MTIPFILLVIGLTIVSFGTSLPELVTLVVAAFRKTSDIAIGNFIGSNIFNMFFIPGVCSLIVFSVLLFAFMFSGKKHKPDRWESAILFLGYAG